MKSSRHGIIPSCKMTSLTRPNQSGQHPAIQHPCFEYRATEMKAKNVIGTELLRVRHASHFTNDCHFDLPWVLHIPFNFLGYVET
jgi:hypothetical protein